MLTLLCESHQKLYEKNVTHFVHLQHVYDANDINIHFVLKHGIKTNPGTITVP